MALNECSDFESKRKAAYIKSGMGGIDGRYHWHSYGNKIIIPDMETGKTGDKFIIANNKDFKETYTFVGRYNFESIDKCFCAIGEKLEKLAAFYSDTVVIKL